MTDRIYLDFAATTPVRPDVLEAMLPFLTECVYNPSSVHAQGRAARVALDEARDRVARCLGAKAKEIVFTGSGSEANNLALAGAARALRSKGRHLVTCAIEHHAVLHPLDALRDEGWDVTVLPVDSDGRVDPDRFANALRPDTVLASVMYANNELGTIEPVADLACIAHRKGVLFHTDAVQAAAYLPVDVNALDADLLTIAAHKFYGPKGAGALFVREGTPLVPIVLGGSQEFNKRAGTENLAGIAGLSSALQNALDERTETAARVGTLRDRLEELVLSRISGTRANASDAPRAPHISSMSFAGVTSDQLLLRLDVDGISVSAGSACASGAIEPSHVIAALGLPESWMRGVVRFSLGRTTTPGEIERTVKVLERAIADLRSVSEVPA